MIRNVAVKAFAAFLAGNLAILVTTFPLMVVEKVWPGTIQNYTIPAIVLMAPIIGFISWHIMDKLVRSDRYLQHLDRRMIRSNKRFKRSQREFHESRRRYMWALKNLPNGRWWP